MKKLFALLLAVLSGGYVLLGPLPDPIPFLDEGLAVLIFVQSLAYLGMDVKRWLPGFARRAKQHPLHPREGPTVDV
jgi:hypothetical protein